MINEQEILDKLVNQKRLTSEELDYIYLNSVHQQDFIIDNINHLEKHLLFFKFENNRRRSYGIFYTIDTKKSKYIFNPHTALVKEMFDYDIVFIKLKNELELDETDVEFLFLNSEKVVKFKEEFINNLDVKYYLTIDIGDDYVYTFYYIVRDITDFNFPPQVAMKGKHNV